MRVKVTPTWKLVAFGGASGVFLLAMIGCAERGWHAPREGMLALIYVCGVALGVIVAFLRGRAIEADARALTFDDEEKEADVVEIKSARLTTLAIASMIGSMTGLGGAMALATLMSGWTALVPASIVGSLYMATYPLHILGAHIALEKKLRLGVDGVRVGRRVIAYRKIRNVTTSGWNVELSLADGGLLRYRCATVEIAEAIAARIAPKLTDTAGTTRVGREGRTLEAWRHELSSRDYRTNEISTEDASRILEAGGASPDERIGAALVLKSRSEEETRKRIRIAASACIDERLRLALEHVADDTLDDETLAKLER